MISYIKGTLEDVAEDGIVLENNGIGYEIKTTGKLLGSIPPKGSSMKIYTYLYVREDALGLFGFSSGEELRTFKQLIAINGIGPKAALAILSTLSIDELRFAVLSQDVKTISKTPGIGTKSAQRLIIELKDKMKFQDMLNWDEDQEVETGNSNQDSKAEATLALVSLGYSNADALRAVSAVKSSEEMDTEELLKAALKKLV